MRIKCIALLVLSIIIGGCAVAARDGVMDAGGESQLKRRQMQTRYFDTGDKKKTMESVLATLQDIGFVIDKASFDMGTVSATKLSGYNMRMTVNVTPRSEGRITVRANAQLNARPVEDPVAYQRFFEALEKSMFLQAHMEE